MRLLYPWALLLLALLPLLAGALYIRRSKPGIRRVIPLSLRLLAITALILVVAGFERAEPRQGLDTVFVVDVSDSVSPEGRAQASQFVAEALDAQSNEDRAAVVLVGETAAVERSLQSGVSSLTRESIVATEASDLSAGLLRALSIFEDQRKRRIVLLSDGQETIGNAAAAARSIAEAGVEIYTVPLQSRPADGEVFIRSVTVPQEVRVNESHEFGVVVASDGTPAATVTVFRDGEYYGEERLVLGRGDNVLTFQGVFREEGIHRYGVRVTSPGDPLAINNEYETVVRVSGEPTVLYVASDPAQPVLRALGQQGIQVDVATTEAMPADVGGLVTYEAVILDNVPAYDMSVPRMEAIERYVRDTGGGLIMIGGDTSFGAGGYYQTPIERALPVDMDVTSTMRIPSLAMLFVIDKSGSMGAQESGGISKLDLVKEAVVSAVEIMNPYYSVGLIAFDADFEWTVPVTEAGNRAQIIEDLSRLESGGGTVLDGALRESLRTLTDSEAAVKHLIVLSDGLTDESDFQPLIEELAAESITVSTVSVGSSADRELMRNMAEWGGGRSYHTADTRSVPRIFAAETTIVSRDLIVEERFIPQVVAPGPILEGIDPNSIPPLEGFVLAYQKNGAQMLLSGTQSNPLLSSWQYGLGRSVAFTSDLRAKWAVNWLDWSGYPQLLAQAVRWAQRPPGGGNYTVRFDRTGEQSVVLVDAFENDGSFRNLLELRALVQPPRGETYDIPLSQTAPGRYEAPFVTTAEGSYLVTVYGDVQAPPRTYGLSVPFAQEYVQFETDFELLELVAARGNGTLLGPDDAGAVFSAEGLAPLFSPALRRRLLIVAVALLLAELIIKKLILPVGTIAATGFGLRGDRWEPTSEGGRSRRGDSNEGRIARATEPGRPSREEPLPSYAELRRQVAAGYQREKEDRANRRWFDGGEHNPVAERKIYIARKRKER
ncbi:MAG: VWA domain-containing protein [Spirochaetales bacterium]